MSWVWERTSWVGRKPWQKRMETAAAATMRGVVRMENKVREGISEKICEFSWREDLGSLDPISWRKRWVSDFRLIFFSFTIRKRNFIFYSIFMNHLDYSVKKKGVVLIFIIRTRELKIGFFGRFISEKSVFRRHGNDFNKIKSKEKKIDKKSDFSLFFPWLEKYEKIAYEGFQTHPKWLEVEPSSHQAIDCTYFI